MVVANNTVAILGFGKLGTVLSQRALQAGYAVYIAGSGDPSKIALSVSVLAPGATATTTPGAIAHANVVILALPLGKYRTLPADALCGKLVIDAMNYWWEVDGKESEFAHPKSSSSEIVQGYLQGAHVVKALSHMGYHHLHDEAKPVGADGRKAIAIAGDDAADTQTVATLVSDFGFDPVIIGKLHRGKILEPGNELFGAAVDQKTLAKIAAQS